MEEDDDDDDGIQNKGILLTQKGHLWANAVVYLMCYTTDIFLSEKKGQILKADSR